MQLFFWLGLFITGTGFLGLVYWGLRALVIQQKNEISPFSNDSFNELMGKLSVINMICLVFSMIGLVILVLGLFL